MPAVRPRASFEPIPTDFDVRTFVETADNFQYVDRISYEMIASNGIEQFEKLVLLHVIIGGKPLVIDGFEEVLEPWAFTPSWLIENHGDKGELAYRHGLSTMRTDTVRSGDCAQPYDERKHSSHHQALLEAYGQAHRAVLRRPRAIPG
jgi:hypothetical protein